jgi:hypothetical protein
MVMLLLPCGVLHAPAMGLGLHDGVSGSCLELGSHILGYVDLESLTISENITYLVRMYI